MTAVASISLIAAVASNGVVGNNNTLPWHLPEDLKYFKQTTLGKPVLMGRATFESIGKPLPGRPNIVLTRNPDFCAKGVSVVATIDEALSLAFEFFDTGTVDELMVIGGAQVYAATLPLAQKLYLTEVHAAVEGDAYFPTYDKQQWSEVSREHHRADSKHAYAFSIVAYEKIF